MAINFFNEKIRFRLRHKKIIKKWIYDVCFAELKKVGAINYIFCSDRYLIEKNKKYLGHNYYTDIITFNYNELDIMNGDIFISIDRVKQNAQEYSNDFQSELYRVIIHGILHLIGYNDDDSKSKSVMTKKENFYIELLYSKFL